MLYYFSRALFANGNVGFSTFGESHRCNEMCRYFGLMPFSQEGDGGTGSPLTAVEKTGE